MSPRPTRNIHQSDLADQILATAWKQIAQYGASALSLRAIARELKITAPAIYNYYRRRDDLVTALICNAYADFGDSQLTALHVNASKDLVDQLMAIGVAYREWALKYPERYQLIFGTPIPGYDAPLEKVLPVAARSLSALINVLESLRLQNKLRVTGNLEVDPEKLALFEDWKKVGTQAHIQSFSVAVLIWAHVHGFVSLEISKSLPPFAPSHETLYKYVLDSISDEYVKELS